MAKITIRHEIITTVDSYVMKTLAGRNRIFSQGKGLVRTVATIVNGTPGRDGCTASFYTSGGSGEDERVTTTSQNSSSGTPYPITTIETLKEST